MTAPLTLRAPAKVNLTLDITGRRQDGFHTLESVMQTVALADTLEVYPDNRLNLECDEPDLPAGYENLALRAALALQKRYGRPDVGARLVLYKRIPAQAGLGGGSADAAAALRALNRLWGLGLGREALSGVAAGLGSDIPFFLWGGTAVVSGVGQLVRPVPGSAPLHLVLAKPEVGMSTADVYRRYDELPSAPHAGTHTSAMLTALATGSPHRVAAALHNDLERAVLPFSLPVAQVREALVAAGALGVLLCGSGAALLGVCRDEQHARGVCDRLSGVPWRVRTVTCGMEE